MTDLERLLTQTERADVVGLLARDVAALPVAVILRRLGAPKAARRALRTFEREIHPAGTSRRITE